jgi:SOS-response transcriptional repressor LexA
VKTFSKFVKARIRLLGKSQKALAQELQVSPAYVSQVLTGKKSPPDLGRPRNRSQLRAWSQCLCSPENDILDVVRYELHRVPPRPDPRFPNVREFLIQRLNPEADELIDEIEVLEMHPAEGRAIEALVQIYLILQEDSHEERAHAPSRFREFTSFAKADKEFLEGSLIEFFSALPFSWTWDPESNSVELDTESAAITDARARIMNLLCEGGGRSYGGTIPVVGHVSAGEGFEFTDGGFYAGEGFDQVPVPPGVDAHQAAELYCVKVRGNSLSEFFGDGTLLFIKPESWEEIKDGDLVIFKDRNFGKAFVKKVEFAGENLILKSMNPLYKNMVLGKSDLMLLEKVTALLF